MHAASQVAANPWVDNKGKHGIENVPDLGIYNVHHTSTTGEYRFIGTFKDILSAEKAFALAIDNARDEELNDDEEDAASLNAGRGRVEDQEGNAPLSSFIPNRAVRDEEAKRWWSRTRGACADISNSLWRFLSGSRTTKKEVLYMDTKGVWCDSNGVEAKVGKPISVLPLAKLEYDKHNMDSVMRKV